MKEAGILEKITRSGFCYPALNQVAGRGRRRLAGCGVEADSPGAVSVNASFLSSRLKPINLVKKRKSIYRPFGCLV
jgi:hypothetical protein